MLLGRKNEGVEREIHFLYCIHTRTIITGPRQHPPRPPPLIFCPRASKRLVSYHTKPWPVRDCVKNYNLSACFQKSFQRLRDRLEGLEGSVAGLEDGCASISERLSTADESMRQFTARAEALREQRMQLGKHADQVGAFPPPVCSA